VVLDLLSGLGSLRDRTKLSSWLTSVTVHHCVRLKRRRRQAFMSLDEAPEQAANVADDVLLPDEMLEKLEKQQLVRQALSMMDEPCRCLLTRLFFEDELNSYEDIAQELGVAVSTIGPKRGRCLKKLLLKLKELGF
jgi:RNA polymerase sigma factor (sigma-70 family)